MGKGFLGTTPAVLLDLCVPSILLGIMLGRIIYHVLVVNYIYIT